MPTYEFKNEKTGEVREKYFKIGKCPKFITHKKVKFARIFSVPSVWVDLNKPKTIGSLAESNTRQMLKEGKLAPPKPKEKPWWRDSDKVNTDLGSLNQKQKMEYVKTGKLPSYISKRSKDPNEIKHQIKETKAKNKGPNNGKTKSK